MSNLFHNPNNFGMNPLNNSINVDSFWLNPMPNNFNNMPQNNMNSFICGFPNSSMPNLQQNFNNLGGNTNQMFNMNNMSINPMIMNNNMNNMNMNQMNTNNMNMNQINPMNMSFNNFNTPFNNMNNFNCSFNNNMNLNMSMDNNTFRKFNSAPINQNMSINDSDAEIQINFRFTNSQIFKIKAKPNEKLSDVISRFKISECPKELKDELTACLCQGKQVEDLNRTLLDLGVKNGEQFLFMKSQFEEKRKKQEMKYTLTEREKEQVGRLRQEYNEAYNKNDNNNNNNNNNETKKPSFIEFIKGKDRKTGIDVNEHQQLVYCLTNINWKCNICQKNYSKENARYYCSVCDYSMCEDCHYKKKYFMKKSFPKCTKPSNSSVDVHFFNADYHHHRLVFCRSSRHFLGFNGWICNNCRETFDNREWSFYCTSCDFDLCCDCCGFH